MKRFKNILYAVAPGEVGGPTLARAVTLAENNQARLTLIDVIPPVAPSIRLPGEASDAPDGPAARHAERMAALVARTEPFRTRLTFEYEVLTGIASVEIIRAVLRHGYDLVIRPGESPTFVERLLRREDLELLRKCPCPVWLTRPAEPSDYDTILAAVDFDPDSADPVETGLNQQILALSSALALSDFAALHLVHVWDAPGEILIRTLSDNPDALGISYLEAIRMRHESGIDQLLKDLSAHLGPDAYGYLAPQVHLRQGVASTLIPELAGQLRADLVVMGTVARSGLAGFLLGNTAEAMLDRLNCSLLVVKPPGFVSPVTLDEAASGLG